MRSTFTLILVLLLAAAIAVAQDTKPQSAPSTPGQSQTQSQPGQQQPADPSAQGMPKMEAIEGCLGGTDPNFTVTDKDGTTYKLQIPDGADTTVLSRHVGESVQVEGSKLDAGAGATADSAAAPGAQAATGSGHSFRAARISRGSGSCSGGANSPKPPDKPNK